MLTMLKQLLGILVAVVALHSGVAAFSANTNQVKNDRSTNAKNSLIRHSAVATPDLRREFRTSNKEGSGEKDLPGMELPKGLKEALERDDELTRKHIWIVDNSGSMRAYDGHCMLQIGNDQNNKKTINKQSDKPTTSNKDCTRWEEVQETVNCHAHLAAALGAPTDFKLLNPTKKGGTQTFRLGYCGKRRLPFANPFAKRGSTKKIESVLAKTRPAGMTPLPKCIEQVRHEVESMQPQLEAEGSKVSIVIFSDGSNHSPENIGSHMSEEERNVELVEALESLQGLPVSVTIRLCTDYGPLVDFFNSLDQRSDWNLSLDVVDDHKAESKEVFEHNPWINYSLLLHRMRERGLYHPVLSLIDERPLTPREVRDFCRLLFGTSYFSTTSLDDPNEFEDDQVDLEWSTRLLNEVCDLQEKSETKKQWNPQTERMEHFINIELLARKLLDNQMAVES